MKQGSRPELNPNTSSLTSDGSAKRSDLLVENFRGSRACFDVSVTHPALLQYGANTVPEAGKAASNREQQKNNKYKAIAKADGKTFYPLVHEAHGRVGKAAQEILQICVQKIAALRRQPASSVVFYWRSRLSLALQVSQARAVHERFRDSQLAHNVGSDESSWLDYRGIAWAR